MSVRSRVAYTLADIVYSAVRWPTNETFAELMPKTGLREFFAWTPGARRAEGRGRSDATRCLTAWPGVEDDHESFCQVDKTEKVVHPFIRQCKH